MGLRGDDGLGQIHPAVRADFGVVIDFFAAADARGHVATPCSGVGRPLSGVNDPTDVVCEVYPGHERGSNGAGEGRRRQGPGQGKTRGGRT